jgi:GSCFA family protein
MTSKLGARGDAQEPFFAGEGDRKIKIGSSFYRGETINFNPTAPDYLKPDFLAQYVLKGWMPQAPLIAKGMKITAFGSCFAMNITRYLSERGFDLSQNREPDIYISTMGEGLVNSYALLGQFEWALADKRQPDNLWHGFKAEGYGYDEDVRLRTKKVFENTDFFIITLGLSEIWYDEPTGGVFWRAVPLESFDPSRHKFRVSTFAETKANLARIYALIREHVPNAKVLFTLSPIPLAATFRAVGCLTANSASKAILRAALDEMLRDNAADVNAKLFYFPSYEIAQDLFPVRFQADGRHPQRDVIPTIMKVFESVYCETDTTLADAEQTYKAARAHNLGGLRKWATGFDGEEAPQGKDAVDAAPEAANDEERAARKAARRADRRRAKGKDATDDAAKPEASIGTDGGNPHKQRRRDKRKDKRAARNASLADR